MSTNKWFRRLKYRFIVMTAIILMFPSTAVAQRIGAGIVTAHAKSVSDVVFDYSEMCFKPGEERAVSATLRDGYLLYDFNTQDIGGPDPTDPESWHYCIYNWRNEDNKFIVKTYDTTVPGAKFIVGSEVCKNGAWVDGGAKCNVTIVDPSSTIHTVTFDADGGFGSTKKEVVSGGTVSAPDDPVKDDMNFRGWFKQDGSKFDPSEAINSDLTVTAKYVGLNVVLSNNKVSKSTSASTLTVDSAILSTDGSDKKDSLTWDCSSASGISASGKTITIAGGTAPGNYTITAKYESGDIVATDDVTVSVKDVTAVTLTFEYDEQSLVYGETILDYNNLTITDPYSTEVITYLFWGGEIKYESSNNDVATITEDGLLTLTGIGTTTIKATAKKLQDVEINDMYYDYQEVSTSYQLTVTKYRGQLTAERDVINKQIINPGSDWFSVSEAFGVRKAPFNATLTYSIIEGSDILEDRNYGIFYIVGGGTAKIKVDLVGTSTCTGDSKTFTVNVEKKAQAAPTGTLALTCPLSADKKSYAVAFDLSGVSGRGSLEYSFDGGQSYKDENSYTAGAGETITGAVRFKGSNYYTVSPALAVSRSITTPDATVSPVISPASTTFYDQHEVTIVADKPTDVIYYTTDGTDPTISSRSGTGRVTFTDIGAFGSTTVKAVAVSDDRIMSPVVTETYTKIPSVQPTPSPGPSVTNITGITVTPSQGNIIKGKTLALSASVLPSNATETATVTWSSGDDNIASVDAVTGVVTGVKAGSTTITASITAKGGTFSAKCDVEVTEENSGDPDPEPDPDDDNDDLDKIIDDIVEKTVTESGEEKIETKIWVGGIKSSYVYTGGKIKPQIRVYDGVNLLGSTEYSVMYKNNINAGKDAQLKVTFINNYKATAPKDINFTIVPAVFGKDIIADSVDIKAANGRALKPVINVKWKDTGLALSAKNYSVSYKNAAGEAVSAPTVEGVYTAVIKPTGSNFEGSLDVKVTVVGDQKRMLSKGKVKLTTSKKTWTGVPIVLNAGEITVTDSTGKVVDPDYYSVSYLNNTAPGKAILTVSANDSREGGYVGSISTGFTIKAGKTEENLSFDIESSVPFVKSGVKPAVAIKDNDTGRLLTEGTDYKISYAGNSKLTYGRKNAYAKVVGKGNYKFTKLLYFDIVSRELSDVTITADDVADAKKWNKPVLTVTDGGKKLGVKDYEIVGFEVNGAVISSAPATGTLITIKLKAKSDEYTGTAEAAYRLIDQSQLINRVVMVKNIEKVYGGCPVTLTDKDMTGWLTYNNVKLVPGVNFVVTGYSKNDKTGTAQVTVRGIPGKDASGNELMLGGTKTFTFKISRKTGKWKTNGSALIGGVWK